MAENRIVYHMSNYSYRSYTKKKTLLSSQINASKENIPQKEDEEMNNLLEREKCTSNRLMF